MDFIIVYLICGLIFNFGYDKLIDHLGEAGEQHRFTIRERFAIMVVWPLSLYRFLKGFFTNI